MIGLLFFKPIAIEEIVVFMIKSLYLIDVFFGVVAIVGQYKGWEDDGTSPWAFALLSHSEIIFFTLLDSPELALQVEAYHLEAFNFPYTFETMLPIIPDQ